MVKLLDDVTLSGSIEVEYDTVVGVTAVKLTGTRPELPPEQTADTQYVTEEEKFEVKVDCTMPEPGLLMFTPTVPLPEEDVYQI
jgi:hypothetical protein